MEVTITLSDFNKALEEEISRIASGSYSDDGASLYDGLRMTSRDEAVMKRLRKEAKGAVQGAMMRFVSEVTESETSIIFELDVTDRRVRGKENMIQELIESALAKLVISKYFSEKQQTELAAKFDTLAAADIQSLLTHLYTKPTPTA